jgi:D-sedoheptulose 7-phosphate isomerase
MTFQQIAETELREAARVLESFLNDPEQVSRIGKAATLLADAIESGHKILSCGNGGSHCDAMHFAEELSGRFRDERRSLPALAISDPSHLTCVGNDYGFEHIFSRFIEGLGQPGDVLFALSTSGNSANIIRAVEAARHKEMKVILLSGKDGGKLAGKADVEIRVPHYGYADRIQEIHIKVIHILILLVEKIVAKD